VVGFHRFFTVLPDCAVGTWQQADASTFADTCRARSTRVPTLVLSPLTPPSSGGLLSLGLPGWQQCRVQSSPAAGFGSPVCRLMRMNVRSGANVHSHEIVSASRGHARVAERAAIERALRGSHGQLRPGAASPPCQGGTRLRARCRRRGGGNWTSVRDFLSRMREPLRGQTGAPACGPTPAPSCPSSGGSGPVEEPAADAREQPEPGARGRARRGSARCARIAPERQAAAPERSAQRSFAPGPVAASLSAASAHEWRSGIGVTAKVWPRHHLDLARIGAHREACSGQASLAGGPPHA
jgi:hypothetical protein